MYDKSIRLSCAFVVGFKTSLYFSSIGLTSFALHSQSGCKTAFSKKGHESNLKIFDFFYSRVQNSKLHMFDMKNVHPPFKGPQKEADSF